MAVHDLSQDNFKSAFLAEFVRACQENPLPTLTGGAFNICATAVKRTITAIMTGGSSCSMLLLIALILERLIRLDDNLPRQFCYLFKPMRSWIEF